MLCALFQNDQDCFEKSYIHPEANYLRNSKNGNLSRSHGSSILDQHVQNIVLINNSETAWPTKI